MVRSVVVVAELRRAVRQDMYGIFERYYLATSLERFAA